MLTCIFCSNALTSDTKPEHILLSALGGRMTRNHVICSTCNERFGGTIDSALAAQVVLIRNLLQLESGTRNAPPMIRNIPSGNDVVHLQSDGTPILSAKPFTITDKGDGTTAIQIHARTLEDIDRHIPNIAKAMKVSEAQVREWMKGAEASIVSKRPDTMHFSLSLGGHDAIRSMVKSCLVLWATHVGNEEVMSAPYNDTRKFVVSGDESFLKSRTHIDSRFLHDVDALTRQYGSFFNLVYIRSNSAGKVIGHFTLYNILSWQVVLAENGGVPDTKIGLASNPLDPRIWSAKTGDELDIEFIWLDSPDYSDEFDRSRARISAVMEHYFETARPREIGKIVTEICAKYGYSADAPITDREVFHSMTAEISQKVAHHFVGVPHIETLTGEQLLSLLADNKE
jgi:hypothetical protein